MCLTCEGWVSIYNHTEMVNFIRRAQATCSLEPKWSQCGFQFVWNDEAEIKIMWLCFSVFWFFKTDFHGTNCHGMPFNYINLVLGSVLCIHWQHLLFLGNQKCSRFNNFSASTMSPSDSRPFYRSYDTKHRRYLHNHDSALCPSAPVGQWARKDNNKNMRSAGVNVYQKRS